MAGIQGRMSMPGTMPLLTYWQENQVAVMAVSRQPLTMDPAKIIESLHLERLNTFLNSQGFNLKSFGANDIPHPLSSDDDSEDAEQHGENLIQEGIEVLGKGLKAIGERLKGLGEATVDRVEKKNDDGSQNDHDGDSNTDLNSPIGKYLFVSGSGTFVISFFHIEQHNGSQEDSTVKVVNLINSPPPESGLNEPVLTEFIAMQEQEISSFIAMPNWLNGGSQGDRIVQGCPVTPPIPVPSDASCPSSPGLWPITLPELSESVQSATGAGVTVFILDALPDLGQIQAAADTAAVNNFLLPDVASNVTFNYQILSDTLDVPGKDQPETGKDIYGRLVGLDIPDHGLFIAGIVHSIAPDAQIECIRVLNDFCVGDTTMLSDALAYIQSRMLDGGNLHQQPVVINMSLIATPTDQEIRDYGFDPNKIAEIRFGLFQSIQSLIGLGAVFVASAGNEADGREGAKAMNPSGMRPGPRYPAAFAYDFTFEGRTLKGLQEMIPVGAVNKTEGPASYSCYPRERGVATYGGGLPTPIPPQHPASPPPGCLTTATDIDALIGIYSSSIYPSLSIDDCEPEFPAPNSSAWAYWSGTSFASPIISALAARFLQLKSQGRLPGGTIHDAIIGAATRQVVWDHLDPSNGVANGPVIRAVQCQNTPPVK